MIYDSSSRKISESIQSVGPITRSVLVGWGLRYHEQAYNLQRANVFLAAIVPLANQLQRSVNLLFGSVLASISLTISAALMIGFLMHQTIVLGLDGVNTFLLLLTLGVSTLTFASARTNVLLGAVHLLFFLAYVMLIFEK